jgi:hypothetical protein
MDLGTKDDGIGRRVGAQPFADNSLATFERRAKARKGKPIEYQPAAISDEQSLHLDGSSSLDSSSKPVQ